MAYFSDLGNLFFIKCIPFFVFVDYQDMASCYMCGSILFLQSFSDLMEFCSTISEFEAQEPTVRSSKPVLDREGNAEEKDSLFGPVIFLLRLINLGLHAELSNARSRKRLGNLPLPQVCSCDHSRDKDSSALFYYYHIHYVVIHMVVIYVSKIQKELF